MYFYTTVSLGLLAITQLVAGHGAIIKAVGDMGGAGSAIGVVPDTPRDGTKRNPFQQDSTRFRGQNAATCGQTVGAGENNIETGTKTVLDMNGGKLPQVKAGGEVTMTLHQVNADGAGPYTCAINTDGKATSWQKVQVTQQVPGTNSNDRNGAKQDFPLKAAMPQGMSCTGNIAGQNNVCLVRCMNAARAGPFGGCVPVQAVSNAAGNSTNNSVAPMSASEAKADEAAADAAEPRD